MEIAILDFIQAHLKTPFLDVVMKFFSFLGDGGMIWLILSFAFIIQKKYRKIGFMMLMAIIFEVITCNLTLKPLIARPRPYDINTNVNLIVEKLNDFSFPSGHTTSSFAIVAVFMLTRTKFRNLILFIASMIAFSRIYLYVHFPTDIIGGIILGLLCGYFEFYLVERKNIFNIKNIK